MKKPVLIGLSVLLIGCSAMKKIDKKMDSIESCIRGGEYKTIPELASVYFDIDKVTLRNDALDTLDANAKFLKEHDDLDILVEGYCDEQGGERYNLGLGQLRANVVRDHYILLGIDSSRLGTISYGKELPVCLEHVEKCWLKNRRSDTKVR